jgi:hypothetical protein
MNFRWLIKLLWSHNFPLFSCGLMEICCGLLGIRIVYAESHCSGNYSIHFDKWCITDRRYLPVILRFSIWKYLIWDLCETDGMLWYSWLKYTALQAGSRCGFQFDSWWCNGNFSLTNSFLRYYVSGIDSASKWAECQECFLRLGEIKATIT